MEVVGAAVQKFIGEPDNLLVKLHRAGIGRVRKLTHRAGAFQLLHSHPVFVQCLLTMLPSPRHGQTKIAMEQVNFGSSRFVVGDG